MKKYISLIVLFAVMLTFCACNASDSTSNESTDSTQEVHSSELSAPSEETTSEEDMTKIESTDSTDSSDVEISDPSNDTSDESTETPESTDDPSSEDPSTSIDSSEPEDSTADTSKPDHEYDYATRTEVQPTCTQDGYYIYSCSCGVTKNEASGKKATGHSYSSWKTTKAATCTAKGSQTRTCSSCSNTETKDIDALGHSWDSGKTSGAIITYTCTRCQTTKTESNGTCSHTYKVTYVERQGTQSNRYGEYETTFRTKYNECTKCGYKKVIVAEHECTQWAYDNKESVVVKGNCVTEEIWRWTCNTCDYYWEENMGIVDYEHGPWTDKNIHLTDYGPYTNELDVMVSVCGSCGIESCGYILGKGFEPYGAAVYDWGIDTGTAYDISPNNDDFALVEHPTWQTVYRDYKYNSSGLLIGLTIIWHDSNGNRYSDTVDLTKLPQMFADAGFDLSKYNVNNISFILKPNGSKIVPSRITFVG